MEMSLILWSRKRPDTLRQRQKLRNIAAMSFNESIFLQT